MKPMIRSLCLAFLFGGTVFVSSFAWGSEPNENAASRDQERIAFINLAKNSREKVDLAYQTKGMRTKGLGRPFDVKDKDQIGVQVWFELADGTNVNPLKKKLRPKDRFYIHVLAASPLYLSLFQIDSETNETQLIYPSEKFRNNRKALQEGEHIRLPVVFALDDDYKDEILSLVVVRADWLGINDELTRPAGESVEKRDDQTEVTSRLTDAATVVVKSLCDAVVFGKNISYKELQEQIPELSEERAKEITEVVAEDAPLAKFNPTPSEQEESKDSDVVSFYMLGSVPIGQWTLKISKDAKN